MRVAPRTTRERTIARLPEPLRPSIAVERKMHVCEPGFAAPVAGVLDLRRLWQRIGLVTPLSKDGLLRAGSLTPSNGARVVGALGLSRVLRNFFIGSQGRLRVRWFARCGSHERRTDAT